MHAPINHDAIAVRARAVTLSLGTREAPVEILKAVDLDIARGESLAILGASGSGKSSLMAVLSGLERASSSSSSAPKSTPPTMTALENVAVPLELAGVADAFDLAARELTAVGLGHRLDHYPAQLSGGEQQRVAIARAVAPAPEILFADEPTGNLDAATGAAVVDLLFERRRATGATLLIITHDPALAQRCDRTVEMRDGRIL